MPENKSKRCEFVSKDLVVRLDMDLVGDVHAIDPIGVAAVHVLPLAAR